MDDSLKIQMDIKNNAEDLRNYLMDLRSWEDEMKEKEKKLQSEKSDVQKDIPPPRNKIKRSKSEQGKSISSITEQEKRPKKISAYDYSSWDKFDVDKACEEVDKEETGEESSDNFHEVEKESGESKDQTQKTEKDLKLIDQAFYEKELGNQFVKKEKWDDAIKCYTKAIEYDDKNAIYYANRSLCFLKLKKFKQAEVDSTIAIQLDKKYVKAYQRRALARTALGQLKEAKNDYDEILRIEPKNSLALLEKTKIEKKLAQDEESLKAKAKAPSFNPKNIFESKKNEPSKKVEADKKSTLPASRSEPNFKNVQDATKILAEEIKKAESINLGKRDRRLIEEVIEEKKEKTKEKIFNSELTEGWKVILPVKLPPHKRSKKPLRRIEIIETSGSDVVVVPKKESQAKVDRIEVKERVAEEINKNNLEYVDDKVFEIPKTCVQFQKSWKVVKNDPEMLCSYLKNTCKQDLASIFGESLESDLFGEIITSLADEKIKKESDVVYFYLQGLSTVKRFGSLVMFMSAKEKDAVKKLISGLERPEEELKKLRSLYEL